MTKEEKVEYYYQKILTARNSLAYYFDIKSLSSNKVSIRHALSLIVDSNNDFLLTDSFIMYLIGCSVSSDYSKSSLFRQNLYNKLLTLVNPDQLLLTTIDFIDSVFPHMINHYFLNYNKKGELISLRNLFNEKENELYDNYDHDVLRIHCDKNISDTEYVLWKRIFEIIAAYCLINNDIDNYSKYTEAYFNNFGTKFDELIINGISHFNYDSTYGFRYEYDINELAKFVINGINRKNNKKLIK